MKIAEIRSLKIGPYDYEVIHCKNPDKRCPNTKNSNKSWGLTDNNEARIYLKKGMPDDLSKDTLLHEVMHAVYFTSGLSSFTEPKEENVVTLLATHLYGVFKDNPELLTILGRQ